MQKDQSRSDHPSGTSDGDPRGDDLRVFKQEKKTMNATGEIKAQLYAGNPLSITNEELALLLKYPAIGNQRPQMVDNGDGTFDVLDGPNRTGAGRQHLSRVTETTARIYVDGHRFLPLFAHAVLELRESIAQDALASVLCHTEESGLFSDPEASDKVAAFLLEHYRVAPK